MRGVQVTYDLEDTPFRSVLVVGGTRQLAYLLGPAPGRGVRIVQRLDGINRLHRSSGAPARRTFCAPRSLRGSWYPPRCAGRTLSFTRAASPASGGTPPLLPLPSHAAWPDNGVDLDAQPQSVPADPPAEGYRLLLVEGSLMGGYEQGQEAAEGLAFRLASRLGEIAPSGVQKIELMIVGRVCS